MSNLVFNPQCKDYFKAKACVAISLRFNYAGSCRTYRFPYLSFMTWSSSFRAAICYVLRRLEDAVIEDDSQILSFCDVCSLFVEKCDCINFNAHLEQFMRPYFNCYLNSYTPSEKLSFVYLLTLCLSRYNLGEVRFDHVCCMFEWKSAIRYAALKFFSETPFIEIESDFMFKNVLD